MIKEIKFKNIKPEVYSSNNPSVALGNIVPQKIHFDIGNIK